MKKFNYPTFSESYPKLNLRPWRRKWLKQLVYQMHILQNQPAIDGLLTFANATTLRQNFFNQLKRLGTVFNEGYVLAQFSVRQRMDMIQADVIFAEQNFPEEILMEVPFVVLADLGNDLTIRLKCNDLSLLEGLWNIGLYESDERVYLFSFSMACDNYILVGSIQGASNDKDAQLIKKATKTLHGMRPQQLMVWLALALGDRFNLPVKAMSNTNHPRMNWKKRLRKKFIFTADYDSIWQSYHGERQSDGNWLLPPMKMKTIEEIASKKRSMYRKRYAMLDALRKDMIDKLH